MIQMLRVPNQTVDRHYVVQCFSRVSSRWVDYKTFRDARNAESFYNELKEKHRFQLVERTDYVLDT